MRLSSAIVTGFIASACAATTDEPVVACTRELRVHFTPAETTIAVGHGFSASVALASCGGAQSLTDVITWQVENDVVASVDPATGRVTGRAPGETRVLATGERYGEVGSVQIVVQTPVP